MPPKPSKICLLYRRLERKPEWVHTLASILFLGGHVNVQLFVKTFFKLINFMSRSPPPICPLKNALWGWSPSAKAARGNKMHRHKEPEKVDPQNDGRQKPKDGPKANVHSDGHDDPERGSGRHRPGGGDVPVQLFPQHLRGKAREYPYQVD